MSGEVHVVAAVLRREGRFLVGRRPAHKRHGGLWEFPGGKVLQGETRAQALGRELLEELGLTVTRVGAELASYRDPGSIFVVHFVETRAAGEPRALEHEALRWGGPTELGSLPLAPTDARFVEDVLR